MLAAMILAGERQNDGAQACVASMDEFCIRATRVRQLIRYGSDGSSRLASHVHIVSCDDDNNARACACASLLWSVKYAGQG